MAVDLLLKVNKEDYLAKISELDQKLASLRDLLGRYQQLKKDVDMFVEDGDSNYQNMQANVDANIDAVQRAIGITQKSKDTLQKTVDQMDSMSSKTATMMSEAAQTAKSAIQTAIRVDSLL